MKIHKYERIFVLKKSAHKITQYGDKKLYSPLMMSSPYHYHTMKVRIYCFLTMSIEVGN